MSELEVADHQSNFPPRELMAGLAVSLNQANSEKSFAPIHVFILLKMVFVAMPNELFRLYGFISIAAVNWITMSLIRHSMQTTEWYTTLFIVSFNNIRCNARWNMLSLCLRRGKNWHANEAKRTMLGVLSISIWMCRLKIAYICNKTLSCYSSIGSQYISARYEAPFNVENGNCIKLLWWILILLV